jgi:hypothetical protein
MPFITKSLKTNAQNERERWDKWLEEKKLEGIYPSEDEYKEILEKIKQENIKKIELEEKEKIRKEKEKKESNIEQKEKMKKLMMVGGGYYGYIFYFK